MKNYKKVGILFGGKSDEHEISIKSAKAVYSNIDKNKFEADLIYIRRDGKWVIMKGVDLLNENFPKNGFSSFIPWQTTNLFKRDFDILFPVLHGPNGEDGRIQGLFEMSSIPFVGANALSSALAMDKAISKTLFRDSGLNITDFLVFVENDPKDILEKIEGNIGYPCFIKPCSLGSSVGITKAKNREECRSGVKTAFEFDKKIIVEKEIKGLEVEISVMGNHEIKVSKPGSFIPSKDFYSYEDKYILGDTKFFIPAKLDSKIELELKKAALKAYKSLYLNGFARVDFFVEENSNRIIINEINTIPGFTEISMFPKLWEVDGISFSQLITKLIDYGFEYYKSESRYIK